MDRLPLICALAPLLFIAALFAIALKGKQIQRQAWKLFAKQYALDFFTEGFLANPKLSGTYRRRDLIARTDDTLFYSRSRVVRTEITVNLNCSTNFHLSIFKKSLIRQTAEMIVTPMLHTGDEFIDRLYDVKGQPANYGIDLLRTPILRSKLETPRFFRMDVNAHALVFQQTELVYEIQSAVDYVCDLADIIEAYDLAQHSERR